MFQLKESEENNIESMCRLPRLNCFIPPIGTKQNWTYLTKISKTKTSFHGSSSSISQKLFHHIFLLQIKEGHKIIQNLCLGQSNYFIPLFILIKAGPYFTKSSNSKSSVHRSSEQHTVCFIRFSCSKLRKEDKIIQNLGVCRLVELFYPPCFCCSKLGLILLAMYVNKDLKLCSWFF